jgi:hypothetical protein
MISVIYYPATHFLRWAGKLVSLQRLMSSVSQVLLGRQLDKAEEFATRLV